MRLEGASESQQRAFDSAMAGRNIFLTGEAGSGKSWLINKIINEFEKQNRRVLPETKKEILTFDNKGFYDIIRLRTKKVEILLL